MIPLHSRRVRIASLLALLGLSAAAAGCATLRGGESEPPPAERGHPSYRIWHSGGTWRLRAAPGGTRHRFQGSVDGLTGGIVALRPDRPDLADHVARERNRILFDFEAEGEGAAGFDADVTGGCLRFDLYVDGKRRPDLIRFGSAGAIPRSLPAVSCP